MGEIKIKNHSETEKPQSITLSHSETKLDNPQTLNFPEALLRELPRLLLKREL